MVETNVIGRKLADEADLHFWAIDSSSNTPDHTLRFSEWHLERSYLLLGSRYGSVLPSCVTSTARLFAMASRIVPPIIAVVLGAGTGVYIFSELFTHAGPSSWSGHVSGLTPIVPPQSPSSNRTGSRSLLCILSSVKLPPDSLNRTAPPLAPSDPRTTTTRVRSRRSR